MSFRRRFVRVLFAGLMTVALSTGVVLFTGCPEESEMGPMTEPQEQGEQEEQEMPEQEEQEMPEPEGQEMPEM